MTREFVPTWALSNIDITDNTVNVIDKLTVDTSTISSFFSGSTNYSNSIITVTPTSPFVPTDPFTVTVTIDYTLVESLTAISGWKVGLLAEDTAVAPLKLTSYSCTRNVATFTPPS